MIKNTLYTIGIISTIAVYYLFYEYQNKRFESLESKLLEISEKIDTISNTNSTNNLSESLDYKENNIVKTKIVNFSDSLISLFDNDSTLKKITELSMKNNLDDKLNMEIDTLCFDLAEQFKIINFYSNKIRIKNLLVPGSILLSINDSLKHNGITYILRDINGEGSYIELENADTDTSCKFHKIN